MSLSVNPTKSPIADVIIEPFVGGRWYERGQDGSECTWGTIAVWNPPQRLELIWKAGPEWETEVEVLFTAVTDDITDVRIEHRLNRGDSSAVAWRERFGNGWGELSKKYAQSVEHLVGGRPSPEINIVLGNHSAVVVPSVQRETIREFYCGVLGCEIIRERDGMDNFLLGGDFHIAMLYQDVSDENEFLRTGRAMYLELKSDNVTELRRKIVDSGVHVLDIPDPHLYFQAPGGQVFRLVGLDEDLTQYERDA